MNPFYPAQIAVGLALGYLVGRHLHWPFARWTWVVPGSVLLIVALFAPVPAGLSRVGYLFGWSGFPRQGTLPLQLAVTMPFYLSAAYSIAAWIGNDGATNGPQLCQERHCDPPPSLIVDGNQMG